MKAMKIMESFVEDFYSKIALESSNLSKYAKKNTVSLGDMKSAARLVLPGELSKHAASEGMYLKLPHFYNFFY